MINWQCKPFSELTTEELYKIIQLRIEVFVIEQNCPYQDCDGKDLQAYHCMAWDDDQLVAYTRLLPPGVSYPNEASIGRVLTSAAARGHNLGKELMTRSINEIQTLFGKIPIKISAQLYLKLFYESFSFVQKGEVYQEDGIDHVAMIRK